MNARKRVRRSLDGSIFRPFVENKPTFLMLVKDSIFQEKQAVKYFMKFSLSNTNLKQTRSPTPTVWFTLVGRKWPVDIYAHKRLREYFRQRRWHNDMVGLVLLPSRSASS
jgi:hypothetical protein